MLLTVLDIIINIICSKKLLKRTLFLLPLTCSVSLSKHMSRALDVSDCLVDRVPSKRRPEHREQRERGVLCRLRLSVARGNQAGRMLTSEQKRCFEGPAYFTITFLS